MKEHNNRVFLIVNIEKSSYPTELNLKCKISHKLSCS